MNLRRPSKTLIRDSLAIAAVALAGSGTGVLAVAALGGAETSEASSEATSKAAAKSDSSSASQVDLKNLPLGDGRYSYSGPRRGYVYTCQSFGGGGAFAQGPWIDAGSGTWDSTEKIAVRGSVKWSSSFDSKRTASSLSLDGNGLPNHATGTFPISASDPAYSYDRNPNSVRGYTLDASLPANPKRASDPTCVGGTVGVAKNGTPIYSAFDAGGRDAVATEIQDRCDGHPEISGQYHYHSVSDCLVDDDDERRSQFVGWALDGFGIYVERDADGNRIESADLDACNGRTSKVRWHGEKRRIYHYVATDDFPYTVACYRGTPISQASGLHVG